jgi:hypothetical protein
MKTKKLFIIFSIILLATGNLISQEYLPLCEESKVWNEMDYGWGQYVTRYTFLIGDTIIDNVLFKEVYTTLDSLLISDFYYCGAIYEDTLNKKVYFKSPYSQTNLLYNFNLEKGDTITFWYYGYPVFYEVDSVDYITDELGAFRKRIIFNDEFYYFTESWVEGVGSNWGLTTPGNLNIIADANTELLCMKQNNSTTYYNPDYDTCYIYSVGINENRNEKPDIQVFSQTYKEYLVFKINGLNVLNYSFEIYDMLGRRLIEDVFNGDYYKLSKQNIQPGTYICRITDFNKINLTIKFTVSYQ